MAEDPDVRRVTQRPDSVWVWGIPLARLTMAEVVTTIGELIAAGKSAYFITANTHYAMLTAAHPDLAAINAGAAFVLADGAPLVWASRWIGAPLPERVAGSDLIFALSAAAAQNGYRLFLVGGAEQVAAEAARRLGALYPGLQVVGTECPPFREWTAAEEADLIARIRAARPDLLLTAFTMPKGERWLAARAAALGVPVVVNVGAAIDFAAGRIRRAPRWMQRSGLEWAFRLVREPRRLFSRYARNAWFIARMVARDLGRAAGRRRLAPAEEPGPREVPVS
jgi:N-acetylglucosaminyldiphosphoundecaprenol N-acetyl-beta-D-mannosaminyltransferase